VSTAPASEAGASARSGSAGPSVAPAAGSTRIDPVRVAGWDRISATALTHTAQAVASEALRTPYRDVRAHVSDDGRGALAVEVTGPLVVPVLGSGERPTESVVVTAHRARDVIAQRLRAITGRQVARVSVTFASSIVDVPRRVR
jgi:hypothetical protein